MSEQKNSEQTGAELLYHSLNKKMIEMAQLLDATNLKTIDIADNKDKSFERLKTIWESAAKVAEATKSLGQTAGILKPDATNESNRSFVDTIAQERN